MIDLVVPTIGRPSLQHLLSSLATADGPLPDNVFVVDDRRDQAQPLQLGELPERLRARLHVLCGRAAGPAAARNLGWRASAAEWIAFVDDDVTVGPRWLTELADDIHACTPDVAGSQGRLDVPLPAHRRPTDWERNVAGLMGAQWITADCAYRRASLVAVGGFDERFRRAFREDSDLALRIVQTGQRIVRGTRNSTHRVGSAAWDISIALQAGNADDVLMEALHGPDWYERAGAPRGAFGNHVFTASAAAVAAVAASIWIGATLRFAIGRIIPGPRTPREIGTMLVTSTVIPFAAIAFRIAGYRALKTAVRPRLPRAVLFDRDGTLIIDRPYNGDPAAVEPMAGAREALATLRNAGIATGIVSNQAGIALGKVSTAEVEAVNARIEALLGPFDTIVYCPHHADAGCLCRKPAPGLIIAAAARLGITAQDCVVVGDIGSDIAAAEAAGARAILVPTPLTKPTEIRSAPHTAGSITAAVEQILAGHV